MHKRVYDRRPGREPTGSSAQSFLYQLLRDPGPGILFASEHPRRKGLRIVGMVDGGHGISELILRDDRERHHLSMGVREGEEVDVRHRSSTNVQDWKKAIMPQRSVVMSPRRF